MIDVAACQLTTTYYPCSHETFWARHADALSDATQVPRRACKWMANKTVVNFTLAWLDIVQRRKQGPVTEWSVDVFSYFSITNSCSPVVRRMPIEPLISFLRHPFYICYNRWSMMLNKNYMLPLWRTEIPVSRNSRGSLRLFFDLGASLYGGERGSSQPSSQSYFLAEYSKRGIDFDRILAWEAINSTDAEIRRGMPPRLKRGLNIFREPPLGFDIESATTLSYFNYPVSAEPGSASNPLTLLGSAASVFDFVVIKLDIDAPLIERALVQQILTTPAISDLIDEIYWEHHVLRSPMMHQGWQYMVPQPAETLQDSHRIFGELRQLGIRAHSWV